MKLKAFVKEAGKEQAGREAQELIVSDISIDKLLNEGLLSLSREIRNLNAASINGKLSPADARDLRDHIKLLFELKKREEDILSTLSDEEIRALAKKISDDGQ